MAVARRRRPLLVAGAAAVVCCPVLAGCGAGAVGVAAVPSPSGSAATACRDLVDRLPSSVNGQDRRDTSPASPYVAAWGDPAIVLRCGGPAPSAAPTTPCVGVNQVDWLTEKRADGYLFTAYGRTPTVTVSVPAKYAPEVNPLLDLATAVRALPQRDHCT